MLQYIRLDLPAVLHVTCICIRFLPHSPFLVPTFSTRGGSVHMAGLDHTPLWHTSRRSSPLRLLYIKACIWNSLDVGNMTTHAVQTLESCLLTADTGSSRELIDECTLAVGAGAGCFDYVSVYRV
jgi:hypothetical protein